MRVLITGGGTGGHLYPALAIARGIREKYPDTKILFVGNAKGLEADVVPKEGFNLKTITVEGLPRKISRVFRVARALFKTGQGSWQAFKILREFKPTVVIGTGGYVCFSVVLIASILKIPTLIQEQNALPGRANRILSRFVSKIAVAFPESKQYFPAKVEIVETGLPVRTEILMASRDKGIDAFKLDSSRFTILVMGGSQGARSINKAMIDVIVKTCEDEALQLIHVTGPSGYEEVVREVKEAGCDLDNCHQVRVIKYLYNMEEALAAADLVICRAGATSIAEITCRGLPAILIPYPYAANNHQEFNAQSVVRNGAAIMLLDRDISQKGLWKTIESLVKDKARLAKMSENAIKVGKPEALESLLKIIGQLSC